MICWATYSNSHVGKNRRFDDANKNPSTVKPCLHVA